MVLYEEATNVVDELETEFLANRIESKVKADNVLDSLIGDKAYEMADTPDEEDAIFDILLETTAEILIDYKWYLELPESD